MVHSWWCCWCQGAVTQPKPRQAVSKRYCVFISPTVFSFSLILARSSVAEQLSCIWSWSHERSEVHSRPPHKHHFLPHEGNNRGCRLVKLPVKLSLKLPLLNHWSYLDWMGNFLSCLIWCQLESSHISMSYCWRIITFRCPTAEGSSHLDVLLLKDLHI